MSDTFTLGTQLIVSAAFVVVVISVTWRAATGYLARNQTMGIRIPSTMSSENAWRAGHRAALPVMWLLVLVAAAADMAALSGVATVLTMSLWAVASVIVVIIAGVVAGRAARGAAE
ncbi:SdpI family protein [Mycobacteroides salmoniphilum]|uniref:SdpI family protein n=1 Tax=Mycobacteroides salmoniphilum TaxID=404941 RepID=UPI003565FC9D